MPHATYINGEFTLIGKIMVDAGIIMIGDPCYSLHRDDKFPEFGDSWDEFCNILEQNNFDQKNTINIGNGLAIVVSSGWGDGIYNVYARHREGRIAAVLIDFMGISEEDDED